MKTLTDRLQYSASGKDGFMACETCGKALDTITRLQGEAGVMRELLRLTHGVIDTIEPEDCDASEMLMALLNEIQAVLKAGVTT